MNEYDVAAGMARKGRENHPALTQFDFHRSSFERFGRIGQSDCHHRVQPANCLLQLRALVFLIRGCICQLFGGIGFAFFQIGGGGQEPLVLRRLPNQDIFVRDDWYAARNEHLISACMIEVIVTVDPVPDGKFGQRLNLADQLLERRGSEEGIEDEDAVISDHKAGVAGREAAGFGNRRVNSVGHFDELKVVFGLWRRRAVAR